jgi:multiple sugar transport system ATP-binding protein
MATVVLDRICKRYDNGFEAVKDLSIEIRDGEFLVLVGPSGCGKTTALRMIAGLESITSGTLRIGERIVNEVSTRDRDIAMVFQSYALYPHMSVGQNMGFSMRVRRVAKAVAAGKVTDAARMLGLPELLDRRPRQLSGGQRQRVAMGRAIVREPQVFLMDEPLSNLDAKMRVQTRGEIAAIQRRLGVTAIYVTHDQVEAMTMGDRVAVMKSGVLQQLDTPQFIYDNPVNRFVASFIGSPPMNLCMGTVTRTDRGCEVAIGSQTLTVPERQLLELGVRPSSAPVEVIVGIRSEDLGRIDAAENDVRPTLRAEVTLAEALGSQILAHFTVDAPPPPPEDLTPAEAADELEAIGTPGANHFIASLSPRTHVRVGDAVSLSVDVDRMHLFDPATGQRLRSP